VNGRLVPLDYALKSGDRVEIITSLRAEPNEKWLQKVKTSRARMKIRQQLRTRTREREEALGREMLRSEFRKRKQPFPAERALQGLLPALGRDSIGRFYADIGAGKLAPAEIVHAFVGRGDAEGAEEERLESLREIVRRPVRGIRIEGLDNILVRFARCCQPVPGDRVVALITRGRGASVHREGCRNVAHITEPGRLIEVEWDAYPSQKFLVSLIVVARNREGLVSEISRRVRDLGTEVRSGHFEVKGGEVNLELVVRISDLKHLKKIIGEIEEIDSVLSVRRAV
jgi:GTP pyrophosphokinase